MLKKFIHNHSERYIARWVILVFDLFMVAVAYALAVFMRFNFDLEVMQNSHALERVGVVLFFYAIGFLMFRSYAGIVRHTNLRDAETISKGAGFAVLILMALTLVPTGLRSNDSFIYVPRSILLIHFFATLFALVGFRILVKYTFATFIQRKKIDRKRVLIFGAGTSGITTMNTLQQDQSAGYQVVGFIDDNPTKTGKVLGGVMVYPQRKVFENAFFEKHQPTELVISIQKNLKPSRKKDIVEKALEFGLKVKIVPPFENWIHGELSTKQIKPVRIEDLLERDPIHLDNVNISREIKGKIVLVSGAAGSIGSEISRQLMHYSPKQIILIDQAESALYNLENEIKLHHPNQLDRVKFVIGDVANEARMRRVFDVFHPEVVYHAAAYKHVPLMEGNPYEAVSVNVLGTKILADLAAEYRADKFVMVSTDKAVNPTNVMGATKRCAEIYTQAIGKKRGVSTQFVITRFGNVLGSNGSVIPLFKKQIEQGGPITLTDKRITRYFMTIPEACNLVLEAGAMANGGEVFVFDMGESVKIHDLAKKMIKLSGLEVNRDIEIVEVGLRPGEKLYEELLAVDENTKPTHHKKIMIADIESLSFSEISTALLDLRLALEKNDNLELVRSLKQIVPEFISNNSIFASLDIKKVVVNE